jgi:hypothetical protein
MAVGCSVGLPNRAEVMLLGRDPIAFTSGSYAGNRAERGQESIGPGTGAKQLLG